MSVTLFTVYPASTSIFRASSTVLLSTFGMEENTSSSPALIVSTTSAPRVALVFSFGSCDITLFLLTSAEYASTVDTTNPSFFKVEVASANEIPTTLGTATPAAPVLTVI